MKIHIDHIAQLGRITLTDEERKKFSADLEDILAYADELTEVDTKTTLPMTGGTELTNTFRDSESIQDFASQDIVDAFPEKEAGFLKVPKVFE